MTKSFSKHAFRLPIVSKHAPRETTVLVNVFLGRNMEEQDEHKRKERAIGKVKEDQTRKRARRGVRR